jgi:hypothetical protein
MTFTDFHSLASYLRGFQSWNDSGGYDFGGAVHLLEACLEGISEHALDADIEEVSQRLSPLAIQMIHDLSRRLSQTSEH